MELKKRGSWAKLTRKRETKLQLLRWTFTASWREVAGEEGTALLATGKWTSSSSEMAASQHSSHVDSGSSGNYSSYNGNHRPSKQRQKDRPLHSKPRSKNRAGNEVLMLVLRRGEGKELNSMAATRHVEMMRTLAAWSWRRNLLGPGLHELAEAKQKALMWSLEVEGDKGTNITDAVDGVLMRKRWNADDLDVKDGWWWW